MSNLLIDTPENLTLEADVAGFGSRFLAALLDYILIFIVLVVLQLLFRPSFDTQRDNSALNIAILYLVQYVILTFYHLFFELITNGQTPGKIQLGLHVVQSNGLPATTSSLMIRNLLRLFDYFPIAYGIGMIAMFTTKNTQRLGDLAAQTVVIYERKNLTIQSVRSSYSVQYEYISRYSPPPAYIRIERLTVDDHSTIVNYLQRRRELNSQRWTLAHLLAKRMIERMELGAEAPSLTRTPYEAEILLEHIAYAFEIRSSDET